MTDALNELLKATSRTFFKTLRVLPAAVRPQISLAYLLARTTDTIADTEVVPPEQRLAALDALRSRILGQGGVVLNFGELASQQGLPAERLLLEHTEDSLALLQTLSADDQALLRTVLDTIISGQELDLKRFAQRGGPRGDGQKILIALQSDAELDDYTYRVAGCVGEFWTRICRAHLFPGAVLDDAQLLADGVRFGKGLQLVNILRDLPRDLQQGRCYLPLERLARAGLKPDDLLQAETWKTFRPAYDSLLALAESHLRAGWRYTNTIPGNQWRVRLACAWPVLIGVQTIERLRNGNPLDPAQRIKISRAEVRSIVLRSVLRVPFPGAFRHLSQS